jgi:hypothetical protein
MKQLGVFFLACWAAGPLLFAADHPPAEGYYEWLEEEEERLEEMPITNQAEWEEVAFFGARHGYDQLVNKALSEKYHEFRAAQGEGDGSPSPLPFLYPKCFQMLELSLTRFYENDVTSNIIYGSSKCRNPAAEMPNMGEVLVAAAEQDRLAVMKYVLHPYLSRVFADRPKKKPREEVRKGANRALEIACKKGNLAMVDFLVGDSDFINCRPVNLLAAQDYFQDDHKRSADDAPMLVALITGNMDALQRLLSFEGIKPTRSMLMMAARHNHFDMVNHLLTDYHDLFTAEKMGGGYLGALLIEATKHDHAETVSWLMKYYPDLKFGLVEAVRHAVEQQNHVIQEMLMGKLIDELHLTSGFVETLRHDVEHQSLAVKEMVMGKLFDEYEDLVAVAAEVGNTYGLMLLLAYVPSNQIPHKKLISRINYDEQHKNAMKLLLDKYKFSNYDLGDMFMRQTSDAQKELFPFIIHFEKYKEVPGHLAMLAMSSRNTNLLNMIVKMVPIKPELHRDIIYLGYNGNNVEGLGRFLRHVKVDPRTLNQYCAMARETNRRDLEEVLCTTQEWLDEIKETGFE